MSASGAAGGFVVTCGVFTDDAKAFVKGLNIELIDGQKLKPMIDAASSKRVEPSEFKPQSQHVEVEPSCPRCGGAMQKRIAKRGANAGGVLWGCMNFPTCRGMTS